MYHEVLKWTPRRCSSLFSTDCSIIRVASRGNRNYIGGLPFAFASLPVDSASILTSSVDVGNAMSPPPPCCSCSKIEARKSIPLASSSSAAHSSYYPHGRRSSKGVANVFSTKYLWVTWLSQPLQLSNSAPSTMASFLFTIIVCMYGVRYRLTR